MKKTILSIISGVIVVAIVLLILYNYLITPQQQEEVRIEKLKPVSLKIMTTWSQWSCDDFNRYFFAESGMPRAGVILPSAAMSLNITNISFIRVEDPEIWKKAGVHGEVDGFIGHNRYNLTKLCRERALRPIEDEQILELSKYVPEVLKGYREDGKLCWIAMYFVPYTWLVNTEFAKKYGVDVPRSWLDLIKPEYAALIAKGVNVFAAYPVPNRAPMINSVNIVLAKYGWEKGWTIVSVVFGAISRLEVGSRQARDAVSFGRSLLTILEFDDAYTAYSMFPDKLQMIFPANETGFWMVPMSIAAGVSEDGLDGMYRLMNWILTEAQDKMFLNRSGWSFNIPVLGFNNTSPRIVYRDKALLNLYAPPVELELVLGEAAPVITLYADVIVSDREIREILREIVKQIVEKYLNNEITIDKYYDYLNEIGKPVEFTDPLTNSKTVFTLDKARELGNAIRNGVIDQDSLRKEFKNALTTKLTEIIKNIG